LTFIQEWIKCYTIINDNCKINDLNYKLKPRFKGVVISFIKRTIYELFE